MMALPAEVTGVHTRLLKCTLEVETSRAYWALAGSEEQPTAQRAFEEYWFGVRSLGRVEVLMANLRARYDAFPAALCALGRWEEMDPDARRLVCHWHVQLSDPMYRAFTGSYLVARHEGARPTVTHDLAVTWVSEYDSGRWNMATRIQFASKLLSAAHGAGLVGSSRDPRPLQFPRVGELALTYIVYLLRGVRFEGTLLENPYLASVGLQGNTLEDRLRGLSALRFRRQGDLVDFGWRYDGLEDWASSALSSPPRARAGGAR
jgi:hypothetical protein